MKLQLDTEILGLTGKPIPSGDEAKSNVTLRFLLIESLVANIDAAISGAERVRRFKRAIALQDSTCADFSVDDISEFKRLVEKAFANSPLATVLVARAFELLDHPLIDQPTLPVHLPGSDGAEKDA